MYLVIAAVASSCPSMLKPCASNEPKAKHSCHHVPCVPLSAVVQQWSRHSRLIPLKTRARGDKKRRPIFLSIKNMLLSLTTSQSADSVARCACLWVFPRPPPSPAEAGVDPTITSFTRSRFDDTRDSWLHIRT